MSRANKSRSKRKAEEADLEEEEEEEEQRSVPVVSGENKRKRAPRGGGNVRRVRLKQDSVACDRAEDSVSSDENDNGDASSAKEAEVSPVEKRQSSRVRIKTIKLRENADAKAEAKPSTRVKAEKKDVHRKGDEEEDNKPPQQHPVKVHVTLPDKNKHNQSVTESKPVVQQKMKSTSPALNPATPNPVSPSRQKATDSIDEEELDTALQVIRKLMKMEAAIPFNKPVDPVGQGVPDYLQVIDTPMDFGTICEALEKREKYKNALDVYRDIQQIWINCRKYNHKGDPILELMKKVQKACSKYWTANGVLRDSKKTKKGEMSGMEQIKNIEDKSSGGHKPGCACVICAAARRKTREKKTDALGSGRATKRPIVKVKVKQDGNDMETEEQEEAYHSEDAKQKQFYPATYQLPLRAVNPLVLSLGEAMFRWKPKQRPTTPNSFVSLVSTYATGKPS